MGSNGNGAAGITLTREQLLARARAADVGRASMFIKELGGTVYVRGLTGKERDKTEEHFRIKNGRRAGQSDFRNFRAFMACRVIVDEQGNRLLNDDDVDIIGKLPAGTLDRILAKSTELSGGTEEEAEDLGNASASEEAADASTSSSREN